MKSEKAIIGKKLLEDRISALRYTLMDKIGSLGGYTDGEREIVESTLIQTLNFLKKKCRNVSYIESVLSDIKTGIKYPDISGLEKINDVVELISAENSDMDTREFNEAWDSDDMDYKDACEKQRNGHYRDMRRFEARPLSEASGGRVR